MHITNLDISQVRGTKVTDHLLALIARHFPHLQAITFSPTICSPDEERAVHLRDIGQSCTLLKSVRMYGAPNRLHAHSSPLVALFRKTSSLTHVHLDNLCCNDYRTVMVTI
eukprot:jgi/Hompol1/1603/HPOL_004799-RA